MNAPLSFTGKVWSEAPSLSDVATLKQHLLTERGLRTDANVQRFLQPTLQDVHDPHLMAGMDEAIDRALTALENEERIMVFGDFDTDGITSTVILVEALRKLGGQVSYRIPDRQRDSHGLKTAHVDEIASKNVKLIITCDCGVNDKAEVAYAAEQGVDVIVTDHHEPEAGHFPDTAVAVLDPKITTCSYPEKNLSGAGIAFKFVLALAQQLIHDPAELAEFLHPFLEVTALGLIADCVELTGENRILAKFGLEKMKTTRWEGLRKLLLHTGTDLETIDEQTVGFTIAPRLNAASRLGDVLVATQLFLGKPAEHERRILTLDALNEQRKQRTQEMFDESCSQIEPEAPCQILFHDSWDSGILGLVASRQVEKLGVPIIALTTRADGTLTASCRAPEGSSMIAALQSCSELFDQFGGHDGAAGFVISADQLPLLKEKLLAYFTVQDVKRLPQPVTAFVAPALLDFDLADFLRALGPFGPGNAQPIFGLRNVMLADVQTMGNGNNHLRLRGTCEGKNLTFVAFFAEHLIPHLRVGQSVDILVTLSENWWQGERRCQLRVLDVMETMSN